MWDTAKDYRILIAMHARELFLRTVQTGSFRGSNKKNQTIFKKKGIHVLKNRSLYTFNNQRFTRNNYEF